MHTPTRAVRRSLAATLITAVAVGLAAGGALPATAAVEETPAPAEERSSFVLPVLPDTQFYSRYSASQFYPKYGTNPFEVQNRWIVENQEELNMPFVVQVGDVVDQQGVAGEWEAADKAMDILTEGGMTYSILPGNHDVSDMNARSSVGVSGNYLARFGQAALADQAARTDGNLIGTFQNGLSSAYLFEAEGHQWMSLALAWNASDDTFVWAQGILDRFKNVPVVLSSHAILDIADDQASPASWWWGDLLWDQLIRKNDQVVLTVSGHFHGATQRTLINDFGNPVHEILTDYQMAADGGNGIMTLFEFDLTGQRIDVETVSPWVTVKAKDALASSDTPVLTGPNQSFSIDFDFDGRFGWTTDPADENGGDLSERAKEIVSEGWDGDSAGDVLLAAGASNDYPLVDGTIAHWRFGSVDAGVVDENTVIPDTAGESPMYRNAIDTTDHPEQLEDVKVSHDNVAFYSADAGAVCFTDAARNTTGPDRLSYITTEYGAPATMTDLDASSGYTLETFLQLDKDWTESANRWSAALTRGGSREWAGINDSSDPGAGAAWLGISSLREYQYSAADTRTANSYTLWSGEIMQEAWHHVAIVNNPAANTAIMYVDGVPVLRNASNVGGMMAADFMPWMIGASTWDSEAEHGWNGCVGETRIVDHALSSELFLYNRIDIDANGANLAVSTDLATVRPSDARVSSFAGTGFAGAGVRIERDSAVLGRAEVAADGTWAIELAQPLSGSGSYDLSFVQSIGSRDGVPLEATLVIGENTGFTPVEGDLSVELENAITVTPNPFTAGERITVEVPAGYEGRSVYGFSFGETTALGTAAVGADGTATFSTPSSLTAGMHRIALYSVDGLVIGWQQVGVLAAPVAIGPGVGLPVDGVIAAPAGSGPGALAYTGASVLAGLLLAAGALIGGLVLIRKRRTA